jgi:hypothetical protein
MCFPRVIHLNAFSYVYERFSETYDFVRFMVLTVVNKSGDVTSRSLLYRYQCFGETCCLHLYDRMCFGTCLQTTWHCIPEDHNFDEDFIVYLLTAMSIQSCLHDHLQIPHLSVTYKIVCRCSNLCCSIWFGLAFQENLVMSNFVKIHLQSFTGTHTQ